MTITNQTVRELFACDGSNQDFAIPFDYQDTDEVTVFLRDNTDPAAPTETQLTEGPSAEYQLTGGPPETTVHTSTAYSSDYQIVIRRSTVIEQTTDYSDGDPFPADDHEAALDKETQILQELNEAISRCVHVSVTSDEAIDTELPLPEAYGYLRWNISADQFQTEPFVVTAPLDFDEATSTWSIPVATGSADGYLSSSDWTTFNSKQAAGNYITALTGDVTAAGPGSVAATIAAGAVNNAKVAAGAAIAVSKLAAVTASRALESDGSGFVSASAVTSTELGYVSGVTSAIQTQLNAKYGSGSSPSFANVTITGYVCTQRRDESSAATLNAMSSAKSYVKLTATVTTINGIAAGADGQIIVIYNNTGGGVTINNSSGSAAAADRIITTDGSAITLADKSPQAFIYDAGQSKWVVWGGGGGGGAGDVVGPASSVDTTVAIFSGASGKIIAEATGVTVAAGVVTATGFVGPLTGNADTATTAVNVSGTVAVANGGTGSTTVSAARQALGTEVVFNGLEDPTKYSVTYDASTRRFTVTYTGTAAYTVGGVRYTATGSASPAAHANTTGLWFLYYDASGVLTVSNTPWDLLTTAPLASVYYTTSNNGGAADYVLNNEKHPGETGFSNAVHKYCHTTIGTRYKSGLAISGYTLGSSAAGALSWGTAAGVISDEDIEITVNAQADGGTYRVFFKTGSAASPSWNWVDSAANGVLDDGTDIYYNQNNAGTWQRTAMGNGYCNYWIVASNEDTTKQMIVLMGQATYATAALAQAATFSSEMSDFSLLGDEGVIMYQITYQRGNAFGAPSNARMVSVNRVQQGIVATSGGAPASTAGGVSTDTTNFNNRLSASDTTIQAALDTLDDNISSMALGGTGANLTAANGAIPYSGAAVMALLAPGTSSQILTSGGAGAPTWQYGIIPQQFGTYASPRTIDPAVGFTSGASHMSTTAREQMIFAQGTLGNDLIVAASPIENGTIVGQRMWIIGCSDTQPFRMVDGGSVSLRGDAIFGDGCAMLLVWNGSTWMSLTRNF